MANKRIDQLPINSNALKDTDLIPIWDVINNKTEKVSLNTLSNFIVGVSGDTLSIKKSLTTAQITGLTTSFEIIPAPGVGKAIQILAANARVLFNTTAFSPGASLDIEYFSNPGTGGTTYWGRWTAGLWVSQTTDRYGCFFQNSVSSGSEDIWAPNDAVVLTASGNQTTGDGSLDIYITYKIITL